MEIFFLSLDKGFDNASPKGLCKCIEVFLVQTEGEKVSADFLIFTQRACPHLILSVLDIQCMVFALSDIHSKFAGE